MSWLYIAVALLEALLLFRGPFAVPWRKLVYSDYFYIALLFLHLAAGILLLLAVSRRWKRLFFLLFRLPELLFTASLIFFLFSYIYALNANMDYVQRFMVSGGAVRLALDTHRERLAAAVKYLPLLAVSLGVFLYWRLARSGRARPEVLRAGVHPVSLWALPLVLLSAILAVLSFPSFAFLEGLGWLSFLALVPLFLVLEFAPFGAGWAYTLGYGVLSGMLESFWVGTFSLVTLQLVTVFLMLAHALFFLPALWLYKRLASLRFLVLALAWVLFEYLRSIGYWGYPWGLWGTAPYRFLSLIQIASVTGVWGVSLVVVLLNCGLAGTIAGLIRRCGLRQGVTRLLAAAALLTACLAFGLAALARLDRLPVAKTVRLALIQQNSDPRKDEYRKTFDTLRRLTDLAMERRPELVVWSETAFVPNIRRWSREDPQEHPLARLVREMLAYQKGLGVWLLTGNDDYEFAAGGQEEQVRLDYNAAVLFDPQGTRVQTYHKVHLVPFTEYFPFKSVLPAVYQWLLSLDVYLWEPGSERTVFRHPRFSFASPICFEDSFPNDIRLFVRSGAEAIVNISNDYWSLTEVEAKQHAVNAAFRAVENRRPLLRATASGLTSYVDADGSFQAFTPYYQENFLVVDVAFRQGGPTLYTRWGDWLPQSAALVLVLLAVLSLFPRIRARL